MAWVWQDGKRKKNDAPPSSTLSGTLVDEIFMTNRAVELTEARGDEAIRAHCLRVATWSSELASAIGLSESDRDLVEQAAIAHHFPEILVDDQARRRLLSEMHLEAGGERPFISDQVRAVLETLWGRRPIADAAMGKIVAVLEISDDFDQFFESEPLFDAGSLDQCTNSSIEAMMTYLQVTSRADVSRVIDRLPVFPRAAREVVRQVVNPDVGPREMEAVASLDPILAGRLIQTANSAYYSPTQPIGTVFNAVSFIGTETARRVLLAAAIRGNFSSPQAHQLWNHSLDVAQTAELVAMHASVKIDPSQAFLAGLIHDIGRLAFAIMPLAFQERFRRLTDGGCPAVEVETCLSGRCHGEVGAETLAQWNFPSEIVEAVRWHHRPERSSLPLSSLLYLAEFVTESQEDLPSYVRMNTATGLAGVSMRLLAEIRQKNAGSLESLRFAA
jgi:putative nucleotidyltransferase with HDIG domain